MNLDEAKQQLVLRAYGELGEDEQETLALFSHSSAECRQEELELEAFVRALALDTLPEISPNLLAQSRMRLDEALDETPRLPLMDRMRNFVAGTWHALSHAPALAALLAGAGFLSGNLLNRYEVAHQPKLPTPVVLQNAGAGVVGNVSGVVQTPNSQVVEVKYNRIIPETMQGSLDDPQIRQLLMTASQRGSDNAVREQSVSLLASECRAGHQCESAGDSASTGKGFRDALLVSLRYDKSPQVRLKALEGLQPFVGVDQRVRDAVLESLMRDPSASVRTRAISMLEPVHADSSVRQVLHTVSTQDDNPFIRTASMQALETADGIQ